MQKWNISDDRDIAYAYDITPDSITLQVELLSRPLIMQSQRQGLVAYFDLTAKKKEKYKVTFPIIPGFAEVLMETDPHFNRDNFNPDEPRQDMERPKFEPDTIDIESWKLPEKVSPLLTGNSSASFYEDKTEQMMPIGDVFVAYNEGRLFYSCKLPLSRLGNKRNKKGLIDLGIAINSIGEEVMPEGMPGGGMGGPGGGMGMPGGGMGGPGGGMGRPGGMGGPGGGMGGPGGPGRGKGAPDGKSNSGRMPKPFNIWIEAK